MPRSPASIAATLRIQAARDARAEADRLAAADNADLGVRAANTIANLGIVGIADTLALADRLAAGDVATLTAWTAARGTDAARAEVVAWAAAHRLMAE